MPDQIITRGVAVGGVQALQSRAGKPYWIITDDQGQEWRCFEPQVAMAANQLQGQMATMKVAIQPARDPSYGMNYFLRAIQPAPAGSTSQPLPLAQPELPMQPQMSQAPQAMPGMPQPAWAMPGMPQPMPQMPTVQPMGELPESMRPPAKTMGQGGNFSDADLTRMARSTAIEAVIGVAFMTDDFRDEEDGQIDWERVYAVAEAASKFILQRKHEGWVPGVEVNPTDNARAVLAEVQAQFPGTTELGAPEGPSDEQPELPTSDDSDIPWGGE